MSRFGIRALIVLFLAAAAALAAQQKSSRPKNTLTVTPPVTTITSFDKDHTVIGWMEIIPFDSKVYHATRILRVFGAGELSRPTIAAAAIPCSTCRTGRTCSTR